MKKLFLFILIIFVSYILLIFLKPDLADKIANQLGFVDFNEKVRIIKKWIDIFSTKIPDEKEIEDSFVKAKEKINSIKENINNLRNEANEVKEKYNQTKEFLEDTSKKIDEVKENIDKLQEIWSWITNIIN